MNIYVSDDKVIKLVKAGLDPKKIVADAIETALKEAEKV
jgi:hypothetical protein